MKVLIVEKDKTVQQSLSYFVEHQKNCEVFLASSMREGASLFNAIPFDMVLCGDRLSDGGGLEILKEWMSKNPKLVSILMMVQSDEWMRESLEVALRSLGYDVTLAGTGEEGLDLFRKENPDLVLLDHWLPGINGDEVLRKIKEQDFEIPVIIMTAQGSIEMAVNSMKMGAFDFLVKPFDLDQEEDILPLFKFFMERVNEQFKKNSSRFQGRPKRAFSLMPGPEISVNFAMWLSELFY